MTAMLEELGWPLLQSRRKKARLTMLYKFRNGLLSIVSEHTPKPGNQKKSPHQTNWQLLFL